MKLATAHLAVLVTLGYAYYNYVAPIFAYQGFEAAFVAWRLAASVLSLIVVCQLIGSTKQASFYLNHLAIAVVFVPSLVLFYAGNAPIKFAIVTLACFIILVLASRMRLRFSPQLGSISPQIMLLYTTAAAGFATIAIAYLSGLSAPNFDLSQVYSLRDEINEDTGGAFGYLQALASKSVLTLAVALACAYRKRVLVIALCLIAVLMFGFTTHKSMALYPLLVIGMYFATGAQNRMAVFVWGIAAITALAALDTWLYVHNFPSTGTWLVSLLARRALLIPAMLNSEFIEVFSAAEPYFWSNSRITLGLVRQPYDLAPPQLVALFLTGNIFSANTGWIGSGYAQAGFAGAAFYSAILGLTFGLLDGCAHRIGVRVVAAASVVPLFSALTSTDLLTAFVTHGIGLTLVMLLMISPTALSTPRGRSSVSAPHPTPAVHQSWRK